MHELSIALSIVDGALEELRRQNAIEATVLFLRVGRLCGVDKESLLFSYDIATQNTPLARSRLMIEDVEIRIFCANCQAERPTRSFPLMRCTECDSPAERVLQGQELELRAMEVVR